MTGEITIRGRVLPIGGLKEKSMAAYKAGKTTVIIPRANKRDLQELPDVVKRHVKFISVETMDEVIALIFPKTTYAAARRMEKEHQEIPILPTVSSQGAVMMD